MDKMKKIEDDFNLYLEETTILYNEHIDKKREAIRFIAYNVQIGAFFSLEGHYTQRGEII